MKRSLVIAFCFWAMWTQAQDTTFFFIYEAPGVDKNEAMISTDDGGFLLVGSTTSYDESDSDAHALKLNSDHEIEWSKHLGWTNTTERAVDVLSWENDGFLMLLQKNGENTYSAYLMNISSEGDFISGNDFGGEDWDFPRSMMMADEDVYVVGKSYSETGQDAQGWIFKANSALEETGEWFFGAEGEDEFYDIARDTDGNFYLCGTKELADDAGRTAWMLKCDADMNVIWERLGDTGDEDIYDVEVLNDVVTFHGVRREEGFGGSVLEYAYDSEGTLLWDNYFQQEGDLWFKEGMVVDESTFAFCGHVDIGVGAVDLMFNTLSTEGNYGPAGVIGSLEDEIANDICIAQNERIYISGYTDGYEVGLYDVFLTYSTNDQPSGANHFELIRIPDELITSVELRDAHKLVAYPNPTRETIRISGPDDGNCHLRIFGLDGAIKMDRNYRLGESISLATLNSGLFIVVITTEKGQVFRTVIQKI